ncbi:MAG: hypothetical protein KBA61_05295 [Spirochaetes bacterium]|nr:hypothetical protein [Spirochaetota bacterium]
MMRYCRIVIVAVSLASLVSWGVMCSQGVDEAPAIPAYSIALEFTRIESAGLDPIKVTAKLTKDGAPFAGAALSVSVKKPSDTSNPAVSAVADKGDGSYEFTVTPDQTGEHPVIVSYGGASITRIPLVFWDVHPDWGQPLSVPGYVNTAGYEDGVTITPDGEYLFVQTGPYRFSSIYVYNEPRATGGCEGNRLYPTRCEHPWINETYGTYTAPERPGFFSGRFSGTTQLHNAASWGMPVDSVPLLALTTMFYGFKRQADGSFTEPFYMAFDDLGDGILGPYGLSFRPNADGTYTVIFSLNDILTSAADIYTITSELGLDINLGDYELSPSGPGSAPVRGSYFPSAHVDLGDNSGTQGNSFLYYDTGGNVLSIWTDDEYDGEGDIDWKKISVYVLTSGTFPSGGTWAKVVLPDSVNRTGHEAIQPTFTDGGLYFTEDVNVVFAAYLGAHDATGYGTSGSWTAPIIVLQKDISVSSMKANATDIGKVLAIG